MFRYFFDSEHEIHGCSNCPLKRYGDDVCSIQDYDKYGDDYLYQQEKSCPLCTKKDTDISNKSQLEIQLNKTKHQNESLIKYLEQIIDIKNDVTRDYECECSLDTDQYWECDYCKIWECIEDLVCSIKKENKF